MKKNRKIDVKKFLNLCGMVFLPLCFMFLAACPHEANFSGAPVLTLAEGDESLTCNWTASVPPAASYDIYYVAGEADSAAAVKGGEKFENVTTGFTIPGLSIGTVYSVVIRANKANYNGIDSNVAKGTPQTQGPISAAPVLTLSNTPNGLICTWTHSVPPASSYDIYYASGANASAATVKAGTKLADKTSPFTISGLANNTAYSVLVSANKAGYPSADSTVKTATVQTPRLTAPILSVLNENGSLLCTWLESHPEADSYDLYWRQGTHATAAAVKAGTKITGAASGHRISGLSNGAAYSVVVTANKAAYEGVDSAVKTGTPSASRSAKRGIGVNGFTAADMALMGANTHWFYNWGTSIDNTAIANARANNLLFMPMFWNGVNADTLRALKSSYPEAEYILGFNEPNLTDQANMTPTQAAQSNRWPALVSVAKELNLKIVSPAMNYGTLRNYGDPIKWLDEFFGIDSYPGFSGVSLDDIDAISIHCYMNYPSALKSYIDRFKKYGKSIWMTEWCAWENEGSGVLANQTLGVQHQMYLMSQTAMYMEQDPMVGRYAWFMLKNGAGANGHNNSPWWALLVNTANPVLTDLGKVYTHMSACDKDVWVAAGQTIAAKDFSANNLADTANGGGWADSVNFRPSTDTADGAAVLDIWNFIRNMWVEYQIDLPQTKNYTLTLRSNTTQNTPLWLRVDNGTDKGQQIPSSGGAWVNTTIDLGTIAAGRHTLRLWVTSLSNNGMALNWLKVE